jgi:hypothetical protein
MDVKPAEIKALIQLLDDDDVGIVSHVSDRIRTFGKKIIPDLEDAWDHCFRPNNATTYRGTDTQHSN